MLGFMVCETFWLSDFYHGDELYILFLVQLGEFDTK